MYKLVKVGGYFPFLFLFIFLLCCEKKKKGNFKNKELSIELNLTDDSTNILSVKYFFKNRGFLLPVIFSAKKSLIVFQSVFYKPATFILNNNIWIVESKFNDSFKLDGQSSRGKTSFFLKDEFTKPVLLKIYQNSSLKFENCAFRDSLKILLYGGAVYRMDTINDLPVPEPTLRKINFRNTSFTKTVYVGKLEFDSLNFEGSIFIGDHISFDSTVFRAAPNFNYAKLPSSIEFHNVSTSQWQNFLDFRSSQIQNGQKCTLFLDYDSYGDNAGINTSKIILPSDRFNLKFSDNVSIDHKLILIDGFRSKCEELGMISSFNDWDIEYKKISNIREFGTKIGTSINNIQEVWSQFGYQKMRMIGWMFLLFFLFWLITYVRLPYIIAHTYFDPELGSNFLRSNLRSDEISPEQSRVMVINSINLNKVGYSLFLTAAIYFGFKIKHEAVNYRNIFGVFYIYIMYLTGLFMVAKVVGYAFN